MKNKKKLIKAICIFLLILIGVFVWYNPELMPGFGTSRVKSVLNPDVSGKNGQAAPGSSSGNGNEPPNSALMRDTVKILDEEQSLSFQSKINSIEYDENFNMLLNFSQLPKEISKAKAGDIIFLPYVEDQFFPETYITKIEDIKQDNNGCTLSLSTPGVDEIFDKFELNVDSTLTKDNLIDVSTLPGVKVSYDKKDYEKLSLSTEAQKQQYTLQPLVYKSGTEEQSPFLKQIDSKESNNEPLSLVLELEDLDLVKLFNLPKKASELPEAWKQPETGMEDDSLTLMLNGKFGVDNIRFYNVAEFGIQYPLLFNNLILGATGDFITEVNVDANLIKMDLGDILHAANSSYDHERDEDKFALDLKLLKIEGLKENTFPIAHVIWNVGTVNVTKPNEIMGGADKQELLLPLSAGIVISVDIEGNITLKAFAELNYKQSIDTGKRQVIKDKALAYDYLGDINEEKESKLDWQVGVEASADMDIQFLNLNAGAYLFNVNFTRFTLTGLGLEMAGKGKLAFNQTGITEKELYGYSSIYSKLMWRVNLSGKTKLFMKQKASDLGEINVFKLDYAWELWRKNWFEMGELPTDFDKETMGYNQISAYDQEYIYYKDISGCLSRIKKDNTERTTLMPDDFFIISAIDKSFVYVMKKQPNGGGFTLSRVNKEDGIDRDIAEGISNCIMQDDQYLYIVPADDQNKVRRLDKKSLIMSDYSTIDKGSGGFFDGLNVIQALYNRNDNEYLMISKKDSFFSSETSYYIVDKKSGKTTQVPREYQYYCEDIFNDYVHVVNMSGAGFLRGIADNVYWESKDGTVSKEIRGISGWNPRNEGIFVQNYNADEITKQDFPYVISLAQASDGEIRNLWNTVSQQAFFTLMNYENKWYFIDQTSSEYILYKVNDISSQPQEVKRVAISDYAVGLDKCSTSMIDGIIFFYSIDGDNSKLLYKYNLKDIVQPGNEVQKIEG